MWYKKISLELKQKMQSIMHMTFRQALIMVLKSFQLTFKEARINNSNHRKLLKKLPLNHRIVNSISTLIIVSPRNSSNYKFNSKTLSTEEAVMISLICLDHHLLTLLRSNKILEKMPWISSTILILPSLVHSKAILCKLNNSNNKKLEVLMICLTLVLLKLWILQSLSSNNNSRLLTFLEALLKFNSSKNSLYKITSQSKVY